VYIAASKACSGGGVLDRRNIFLQINSSEHNAKCRLYSVFVVSRTSLTSLLAIL
jgi:hypothetical protein